MAEQSQTNIVGTTIIYSGHEKQHIHGVSILMSKQASEALIGWKPINERIITARFKSKHAKVTVIQANAPTENSSGEDKDTFYDQLSDVYNNLPAMISNI